MYAKLFPIVLEVLASYTKGRFSFLLYLQLAGKLLSVVTQVTTKAKTPNLQ